MKWIKVTDRLPEENETVIATWKSELGEHKVNNITIIDFINEHEGFDPYAEPLHKEITHWMPLPNPPQE